MELDTSTSNCPHCRELSTRGTLTEGEPTLPRRPLLCAPCYLVKLNDTKHNALLRQKVTKYLPLDVYRCLDEGRWVRT